MNIRIESASLFGISFDETQNTLSIFFNYKKKKFISIFRDYYKKLNISTRNDFHNLTLVL